MIPTREQKKEKKSFPSSYQCYIGEKTCVDIKYSKRTEFEFIRRSKSVETLDFLVFELKKVL